jgi:hypothetical protein
MSSRNAKSVASTRNVPRSPFQSKRPPSFHVSSSSSEPLIGSPVARPSTTNATGLAVRMWTCRTACAVDDKNGRQLIVPVRRQALPRATTEFTASIDAL